MDLYRAPPPSDTSESSAVGISGSSCTYAMDHSGSDSVILYGVATPSTPATSGTSIVTVNSDASRYYRLAHLSPMSRSSRPWSARIQPQFSRSSAITAGPRQGLAAMSLICPQLVCSELSIRWWTGLLTPTVRQVAALRTWPVFGTDRGMPRLPPPDPVSRMSSRTRHRSSGAALMRKTMTSPMLVT